MALTRRLLLLSAAAAFAPLVFAQGQFPTKPVRFIVPFAAGGESDIVARQIANRLSSRGYTIVVENVPGVGGNLGAEKALREPADGYALLVISGAYAGNAVISKPSFDPIAAIQPIVQFTRQPSVLLATPSYKTLQDLVDKAKRAPGTINYGSAGVGSLGHLSSEYFASAAGIKINHIPYKGTAPAITDLAGGQLDMMLSGLTAARALAKSGQVRLLAIGGDKRIAELPDVPTFIEGGVTGFETNLWHGLVGQKDVPPAIVAKLNADINAVLRDPEITARFGADAVTPVGGTPEQFRQVIRTDLERWQRIVKQANIKPQ